MLKALKTLHDLNIIHRDLKPTNIFIIKDNQVLIGDFGVMSFNNSQNTTVGALEFMAPEVKNKQKYDESADIYSMGLSLFNLFNTQSQMHNG